MKRLLLCLFMVAAVQLAHAQYYKTDTLPRRKRQVESSRLILGGSLGLSFGDYTNINVSPLVGYRISQLFAAGINVNAQYGAENFRDFNNNLIQKNKYTIFGGGVWGRVYPLEWLFIHIQPEYNFINLNTTYYDDPKQTVKDNYGVPSLLMGAGYVQPIGGRASFSIMALYDVLQDSRSPYSGIILRIGANLGI